jgi:hypothetical protein
MLETELPGSRRITLGADKGYDTREFVASCRALKVIPQIARNESRARGSALDRRTARHAGYAVSQRIRKRIEEIFGWMKTVGGLRRSATGTPPYPIARSSRSYRLQSAQNRQTLSGTRMNQPLTVLSSGKRRSTPRLTSPIISTNPCQTAYHFLNSLVCSGCSRIERRGAAGRCSLGRKSPSSSEGRCAATALKPERL